MQPTTWRRQAAPALLLAATALAVAGCDRRPSDPARPSIGSTAPGLTPSITPRTRATTPDSSTGGTSGSRLSTPDLPAASAAPVARARPL